MKARHSKHGDVHTRGGEELRLTNVHVQLCVVTTENDLSCRRSTRPFAYPLPPATKPLILIQIPWKLRKEEDKKLATIEMIDAERKGREGTQERNSPLAFLRLGDGDL